MFYGLACCLSWRMFCVRLRRMCIPLPCSRRVGRSIGLLVLLASDFFRSYLISALGFLPCFLQLSSTCLRITTPSVFLPESVSNSLDISPFLFWDFYFFREKKLDPHARLGSLWRVWQSSQCHFYHRAPAVMFSLQCIPSQRPARRLACWRNAVDVMSGRVTVLLVAYGLGLWCVFSNFIYIPKCVCCSALVFTKTHPVFLYFKLRCF